MKLIIDIDDKVYGLLKYFENSLKLNDKKDGNDDVKTVLMREVLNGIPLDKHDEEIIAETVKSIWGKSYTDMLDKIRNEIERKANSGQWSDATIYGMLKAIAIIDKYKNKVDE